MGKTHGYDTCPQERVGVLGAGMADFVIEGLEIVGLKESGLLS